MTRQSIDPFAPADWPLVAGRTALVVVDAQNDFLHEDGWYAQSGVDTSHMQRVLEPIGRLVAACRGAGVPIVWTRHGFRDRTDAGTFYELRPFLHDGGLRRDTWGYQVHESLDVAEEDWLVEKSRLSAFYNTNLELVLHGLRTETVIVVGVLTNQCIAATSKDASFRDLKPIVVEDCTGTTLPHLHEPAIEMIRVGWGVVRDLETVLGELARLPRSPALAAV